MSDSLPKLRLSSKRSLSEQIYVFLRSLIITARIKPGTVFSENELSLHFKISRQPVREALNHLEHDGLVSIFPQKGTRVKKISIKNLQQVVFIRTSLECACIENIANINVKKFNQILKKLKTNILYQQTRTDDDNKAETFLKLDDKFHELICEFSDCEMTWEVIQSFKGQLDRIRYLSMGHESPLEGLINEHELIVKAIENCEINKARQLLRDHLHEVMMTHVTIKENFASWFEEE